MKNKRKIIVLFFVGLFIILPFYLCIDEMLFRKIRYCKKSYEAVFEDKNFSLFVGTLGNELFRFTEDHYPFNIYHYIGITLYSNTEIPVEIKSLSFVLKNLQGKEIKYKTIGLYKIDSYNAKLFNNIPDLLKYKSSFTARSSMEFFYDTKVSSNEKLIIEYNIKLKYENKIYQFKNSKIMTKCQDELINMFFY